MREDYESLYVYGFSDPFAGYLDKKWSEGWADEQMGDACDGPAWVGRIGRHVLIADSLGFVSRAHLAHRAQTLAEWVAENLPEVAEWENGENQDA